MRFLLGEMNQGLVGVVSAVVASMLFTALVVWVFSKRRKQTYAHLERLPLDD